MVPLYLTMFMHFPTTIYTKYSSEILRACSSFNQATVKRFWIYGFLSVGLRKLGFVKKSVDNNNGHGTTTIS